MRAVEVRIVKVVWVDSVATIGWRDVEEEFEPCKVESVGYLWREDKDVVVLAGSVQLDSDGEVIAVCNTMAIPAFAIVNQEDICPSNS